MALFEEEVGLRLRGICTVPIEPNLNKKDQKPIRSKPTFYGEPARNLSSTPAQISVIAKKSNARKSRFFGDCFVEQV